MIKRLLLLPALLLCGCDNDYPPLRADIPYRQPPGEKRTQPVGQRIPQGAQATGDVETRSGKGIAGGERPTSGDHVGAGSNAGGNPHGAPTAGGDRPDPEGER